MSQFDSTLYNKKPENMNAHELVEYLSLLETEVNNAATSSAESYPGADQNWTSTGYGPDSYKGVYQPKVFALYAEMRHYLNAPNNENKNFSQEEVLVLKERLNKLCEKVDIYNIDLWLNYLTGYKGKGGRSKKRRSNKKRKSAKK